MRFEKIELPSNKKFGLFFAAVFMLFASYLFFTGSQQYAIACLVVSIIFAIVSYAKNDLLLPLNKAWMGLGLLLGMIISPIVLGIIFFLIFTPVGLCMRLFGRDELRLKKLEANTYWKVRQTHDTPIQSFKNQF
jgi:hypothetical protein